MEPREYTREQLKQIISIEARRLRDLGAQIADRVNEDPGDITVDLETGEILGRMSAAARAARYAMARRIVLMGGEDPGWGF
jgi:hypothetical protein